MTYTGVEVVRGHNRVRRMGGGGAGLGQKNQKLSRGGLVLASEMHPSLAHRLSPPTDFTQPPPHLFAVRLTPPALPIRARLTLRALSLHPFVILLLPSPLCICAPSLLLALWFVCACLSSPPFCLWHLTVKV
jgi:hypothetical protein